MNGGRFAGTVVYNPKDLLGSINAIQSNIDNNKRVRRKFSDKLLYNKGKSSKIIKRRLDEILLKN